MKKNRLREFDVDVHIKISSLRYDGKNYDGLKRVNVYANDEYFTLDILEPEHGLTANGEWQNCLARYWSIVQEISTNQTYGLYDGPGQNIIGEVLVLECF